MKKGLMTLGTFALGVGLLGACAPTGPGNLRVHQVDLYGSQPQSLVWVYGTLGSASSSVKLGGQTVDVRSQVSDPLATPGSLSVNGKAVYSAAVVSKDNPVFVTRNSLGNSFNVSPLNSTALAAVFYTDGLNWYKLGGVSGTVGASITVGLRGAGQLTDAEADALGSLFSGQEPLVVAVSSNPQSALSVEPRPGEQLHTSLYIQRNIQVQGAAGTTATVTTTPNTPTTGGSMQPTTMQPTSVQITEVARGSNAATESPTVLVATTQAEASSLYALAYGRQSSRPAAPNLNGETLVGIFAGQYNTGGYGVQVSSAQVSGNKLTIQVAVTGPKPGMLTTQALTSPWVMVKVPGKFSDVRVVDTAGRSW